MNILIINQHTFNRGDEAAGKALIAALTHTREKFDLSVVYNSRTLVDKGSLIGVSVSPQARHYSCARTRYGQFLRMLTMILPFSRTLVKLDPTLAQEYRLIEESDVIINAPGGVNIGPYRDWFYLWRLYMSIKRRKRVAIYSISFGPLPKGRGIRDCVFNWISKRVLKRVSFLSLRDEKSQAYARELGLSYRPSADTAFLYDPRKDDIPHELNHLIAREFVVVVPSELNAWHPNYRDVDPKTLRGIYARICVNILARGYRVVMLPQLFRAQNDQKYMEAIKATVEGGDIEVIPDSYDSDIQQAIIARATLLIGARYHSIVFSINNETAFLSLAYEHKMSHMLSMLGLSDRNFDFSNPSQFDENTLLQEIDRSLAHLADIRRRIGTARIHARELAEGTFADLAAAIWHRQGVKGHRTSSR